MRSIIALCSLLLVQSSWAQHWDYSGKEADWSRVSEECKIGKAQSPIDIDTKTVVWDKNLDLQYQGFDQEIDGKFLQLQNNGHTVQLTLDRSAIPKSARPAVSGSAVGNETFEFVQLHFHWDDKDDQGSEHAIDGHRYALEVGLVFFVSLWCPIITFDGIMIQMHYVLANTKYGADVGKAGKHADGLVVLATIFHASDKNDTYMQPLLDSLVKVQDEGQNTTLAGSKILLDHILPDERDLFFQYDGSLTTPPCSQAVNWLVYRDISAISPQQLAVFRAVTHHDAKNNVIAIGHNVRELQKSAGRLVRGSVHKPQNFWEKIKQAFKGKEPAIKLM